MTDLSPNELAELYTAFDRFRRLLDNVADELDTDGTTPMERWAGAVFDYWGGSGPPGAPNYGIQQRDRNEFSINEYRDEFGDGEHVTRFECIDFAAADERIQHIAGDAIDDWDHAIPVAPESNTPLPVAIASTEALEAAMELLAEFLAYPEADHPAPDKSDPGTDTLELSEGRVDSLTVTVLDYDQNPGSKRDTRLEVALSDGTELPFDIWTTHDLSLDWTVGNTYTVRQARYKTWDTSTGTDHQLSSTKDLRVTPTDDSPVGTTPDINPPREAGTDTGSTTGAARDTGTSTQPSTVGSDRSRGSTGTPSRSDLIDAIQTVAEEIDRPLKASDLSDVTQYSVNDVTRVFGSWQNALDAAGVDNEARLIDDLHRVAEELGHRPTTSDMNTHGHVSATTYASYFGTYTAAIEQAFDDTEPTTQTDRTGAAPTTGTSETSTREPDKGEDEATGREDDVDITQDDGILGDILSDFKGPSDPEAE
jgi:hypothetical protein